MSFEIQGRPVKQICPVGPPKRTPAALAFALKGGQTVMGPQIRRTPSGYATEPILIREGIITGVVVLDGNGYVLVSEVGLGMVATEDWQPFHATIQWNEPTAHWVISCRLDPAEIVSSKRWLYSDHVDNGFWLAESLLTIRPDGLLTGPWEKDGTTIRAIQLAEYDDGVLRTVATIRCDLCVEPGKQLLISSSVTGDWSVGLV